jgi:hypothetical protein
MGNFVHMLSTMCKGKIGEGISGKSAVIVFIIKSDNVKNGMVAATNNS